MESVVVVPYGLIPLKCLKGQRRCPAILTWTLHDHYYLGLGHGQQAVWESHFDHTPKVVRKNGHLPCCRLPRNAGRSHPVPVISYQVTVNDVNFVQTKNFPNHENSGVGAQGQGRAGGTCYRCMLASTSRSRGLWPDTVVHYSVAASRLAQMQCWHDHDEQCQLVSLNRSTRHCNRVTDLQLPILYPSPDYRI